MLQLPQRVVRLIVGLVLAASFLCGLPSASAATAPPPSPIATASAVAQPVKILDGTPGITHAPKEKGVPKTVHFFWTGADHPFLSAQPDATGNIFFYDTLKVTVNGVAAAPFYQDCSTLNDKLEPWRYPIDLFGLLDPGQWNTVKVELDNNCGLAGNSDLYLTNTGLSLPPDPTPVPVPSASAVPDPALVSVPTPTPSDVASSPVKPVPAPGPASGAAPSPVTVPPAAGPAPMQPPHPPVITPQSPVIAPPAPAAPHPAASQPAPSASPSAACGWVKFYGVRGSGETKSEFYGYGEAIGMLQGSLQINLPGMKAESIDYPAIPVNPASFTYSSDYVNSVNRGVETLLQSLHRFIADCPQTYAILAGYSQGAEVVDTAYARLTAQERRHIASVTLFGDPEFNSNQPAVDQGDYTPGLSGIDFGVLGDRPLSVPSGWEARVQSYCTLGDPICNFSGRNLPACNPLIAFLTCPHLMYYDRGWTNVAAVWIQQNLGGLPHL